MRIAIPSSPFRALFASGSLTQLEWVERCASVFDADGLVAAVADFPRRDAEYVAQLRKVAVDLALVPFALDDPALLDPATAADAREETFALATRFGALCVRTHMPPPGDVPPAAFVEAVQHAKAVARAAKSANVTVLVEPAADTLGADLDGVHHLTKDVDSAWLRACPHVRDRGMLGSRERVPAFTGSLDAVPPERGWLIAALSAPEVRERLDRGGRPDPG